MSQLIEDFASSTTFEIPGKAKQATSHSSSKPIISIIPLVIHLELRHEQLDKTQHTKYFVFFFISGQSTEPLEFLEPLAVAGTLGHLDGVELDSLAEGAALASSDHIAEIQVPGTKTKGSSLHGTFTF